LSAQEEERKRISRGLHDSIGQSLAAVKFSVENALRTAERQGSMDSVLDILERMVPTIQQTIKEARRIYTGLRPSVLDDLGLIATLAWFCREFQTTYPCIHVEKNVLVEEGELPEPLKIILFRLVSSRLGAPVHDAAKMWMRGRDLKKLAEGFVMKKARNVRSAECGGFRSRDESEDQRSSSRDPMCASRPEGPATTLGYWPFFQRKLVGLVRFELTAS
jgi:hypothetical protein